MKERSLLNAAPRLLTISGALLLFFAAVAIPAARAQDPKLGVGQDRGFTMGDEQKPVSWPGKSKRYALVIGIDKYDDTSIPELGGAVNDAKALRDVLVSNAGFPSENITLLTSDQSDQSVKPTRATILARLSNLKSVLPKDGLLLVSFAGHGIERDGRPFLLAMDSNANSNDVDLLEDTAINVNRIKDLIHKTGVGQVVLILDACRNDPSGGRGAEDNNMKGTFAGSFNFDVRNREVQAFATLLATEVGKRAYEYRKEHRGYFSYALVEGLKGKAANDKGEVTLAGLMNYLQDWVPNRVAQDYGAGKIQRPSLSVDGYRAADLVLAVAPKAIVPVGVNATPTAGMLDIDAEGGASIRIEPVGGKGTSKETKVLAGNHSVLEQNIAPGRYRITGSLDGYTTDSREVDVKVGDPTGVTLKLAPITHDVTIATNVATGTVTYMAAGERPTLAKIENGQAVLPQLRNTTYQITIESSAVGYKPLHETIKLPGETTYKFTLENSNTVKPYRVALWSGLDDWQASSNWKVGNNHLTISGQGTALLKQPGLQHYADFTLTSDIRMLNEVGVSYVLRAQDAKNYYLIQLTGGKGDKPYTLRGFIVKDGVSTRFDSEIPLNGYAPTLKANQWFRVLIKATGSTFAVSLQGEDGEEIPLGAVTDQDNTYQVGMVGLAATRDEQNEAGPFYVCVTCPKN